MFLFRNRKNIIELSSKAHLQGAVLKMHKTLTSGHRHLKFRPSSIFSVSKIRKFMMDG